MRVRWLLTFSCVTLFLVMFANPAAADGGGIRTQIITETYTENIWTINGPDGRELCRVITDTNRPTLDFIRAVCPGMVGNQLAAGRIYLNYLTTRDMTRETTIQLPEMIISARLDTSVTPAELIVTASDPLPGERVSRIEARIGNVPVVCDQSPCVLPLPNAQSGTLTYWATSTLGDSTPRHVAMLHAPGGTLQIIGDTTLSSWTPAHRVPMLWMTPPPNDLPTWLQNTSAHGLYTNQPLYYLAGQIILSGRVGVPPCDGLGIVPWSGGYATQCGFEYARPAMVVAQNKYNADIARAATISGVPSQLLKNIIAQESQFTASAEGIYGEEGLYQLSRLGADTLLRWDGPEYVRRCQMYELRYCEGVGYDGRPEWQRELLISSVMSDANNIALLGDVLTANAAQVAHMLDNLGSDGWSYADLWRLTVINYHAGPDLVWSVLIQIDGVYSWDSFETTLGIMAPGVLDYLYAVTGETQTKIPVDITK